MDSAELHAEFERLKVLQPQDATPDDINSGEALLQLLSPEGAFIPWCQLQLLLASFYLEVPGGDRHQNVGRARAHYAEVFTRAQPESDWKAWLAVCIGLANCSASDPIFDADGFDQAVARLDSARALARDLGRLEDSGNLALTLATTLQADRRVDDSMARSERVIALLEEAGKSFSRETPRWGRVMHNLGVAYMKRERPLRSQNVDLAIKAFNAALTVRSSQSDPVGRVRTLRALALAYPEWGFSGSHAQDMEFSRRAAAEADEIEGAVPQAAARNTGWARFSRLKTSLENDDEELEGMFQKDPTQLQEWLKLHDEALHTIPRASAPFEWARWAAGRGWILNVYRRHGHPDAVNDAMRYFRAALETFSPEADLRLALRILSRMGSMCHEAGEWEGSHIAHSRALELADELYQASGSEESARRQLLDVKGFAQLGAYAAARLSRVNEAVVLAESSRSRGMVERVVAMEVMESAAAPEEKKAIAAVRGAIANVERRIEDAIKEDPLVMAETMSGRLADAIGAPRGLLKFRLADPDATEPSQVSGTEGTKDTIAFDIGLSGAAWGEKEAWFRLTGPAGSVKPTGSSTEQFAALSKELAGERQKLKQLIDGVRSRGAGIHPARLDLDALKHIARRSGGPIVYLLGTIHGTVALAVLPTGEPESLRLDGLNSEDTGAMLYGNDERPGYMEAATRGSFEQLSAVLPDILDRLRQSVLQPLSDWLSARGHDAAVMVPIGRLGQLPLQAAALDLPLALSGAPSGRLLDAAIVKASQRRRSGLLAVGNPAREHERDLPFAAAEALRVASLLQQPAERVLTGENASAAGVHALAAESGVLHFACHGVFRPSDPLESALLLRGKDLISLRDVYRGSIDFRSARLCVLSACRSASVETTELPDEVIGFPVLLMLAGIPAVIATAWAVDDRACALFSQRFYQNLASGVSTVNAMRQAQRWLRDADAQSMSEAVDELRRTLPRGHPTQLEMSAFWRSLLGQPSGAPPPFANPYYWAAFTHSGV